jgi:hypothetical protein
MFHTSQRVQFDRETMTPYKSQAYVKFEETIYVDRFLDRADPEKRRRSKETQKQLATCRERIETLTKGKVCISTRCSQFLRGTDFCRSLHHTVRLSPIQLGT